MDRSRRGFYRLPIYRVIKTITTPADDMAGSKAVYSEALVQIRGALSEFSAKRWGAGVTEDFADFTLETHVELSTNETHDSDNDEIDYNGVRYRIVKARHHDTYAFDDYHSYALRRKSAETGGP